MTLNGLEGAIHDADAKGFLQGRGHMWAVVLDMSIYDMWSASDNGAIG